MKKPSYLKQIQNRLPDDIVIVDETVFEFTEDEFIGILSWVKYFNNHYREYRKETIPPMVWNLISKRLRIDFGLYHQPDDQGRFVIYLTDHRKEENGKIKELSVKEIIRRHTL